MALLIISKTYVVTIGYKTLALHEWVTYIANYGYICNIKSKGNQPGLSHLPCTDRPGKPCCECPAVKEDTTRISLAVPSLPFEDIAIERRSDGRHVRLTNGRRHRAVGRYASVKMGATIPWESRVELHDLYRAEVDPAIVRYFVQPETLFWRLGTKSYRYTPDRLDILAGGGERIVEIKDVFDPCRDPDYTEKLSHAAQIYGALGRSFELRDSATIRLEPSFSAVEEVQAYRRAVATSADVAGVQRCLRQGSAPLHKVLQAIPSERPRPILFALMVRNIIAIDLSRGLVDLAPVALVRPAH